MNQQIGIEMSQVRRGRLVDPAPHDKDSAGGLVMDDV